MRLRILDVAEADLAAGFEFYEQQQEGLGEYFLRSLVADVEALRFHAGIHRCTEGFYRCHAKRFPFLIYYSLAEDLVSIEAVIDNRRDPAWIQKRLRKY